MASSWRSAAGTECLGAVEKEGQARAGMEETIRLSLSAENEQRVQAVGGEAETRLKDEREARVEAVKQEAEARVALQGEMSGLLTAQRTECLGAVEKEGQARAGMEETIRLSLSAEIVETVKKEVEARAETDGAWVPPRRGNVIPGPGSIVAVARTSAGNGGDQCDSRSGASRGRRPSRISGARQSAERPSSSRSSSTSSKRQRDSPSSTMDGDSAPVRRAPAARGLGGVSADDAEPSSQSVKILYAIRRRLDDDMSSMQFGSNPSPDKMEEVLHAWARQLMESGYTREQMDQDKLAMGDAKNQWPSVILHTQSEHSDSVFSLVTLYYPNTVIVL